MLLQQSDVGCGRRSRKTAAVLVAELLLRLLLDRATAFVEHVGEGASARQFLCTILGRSPQILDKTLDQIVALAISATASYFGWLSLHPHRRLYTCRAGRGRDGRAGTFVGDESRPLPARRSKQAD